jgi:hypothetical protein
MPAGVLSSACAVHLRLGRSRGADKETAVSTEWSMFDLAIEGGIAKPNINFLLADCDSLDRIG